MTIAQRRVDLRSVRTLGIDLDLTLIDTRAATAHALRGVNAECGESIDVDDFIARLGPPLPGELARWIPPERIDRAIAVFRDVFVREGVPLLSLLPGAERLVTTLRGGGGRLVVITSRIPRIARSCLDAVGIVADEVEGGLSGVQKAQAIRAHRVEAYVGDHPLDMAGARAAGVPGIGVTTGGHGAAVLADAGAVWVVPSLTDVADAMR